MPTLTPFFQKYWMAIGAGVVGSAVIVASSTVVSEVALMWIGGVVGVGIGGTIVASERRAKAPAKRSRARKKR